MGLMILILSSNWRRCIRFVPVMSLSKFVRISFLIILTNVSLQMLLKRFEHETNKLQMNTGSNGLADFGESSVACCSFTPGMLCLQSAFGSWQDTLPPIDSTSLYWDLELLQELTSIHLDDLNDLHQVRSTIVVLVFFLLLLTLLAMHILCNLVI